MSPHLQHPITVESVLADPAVSNWVKKSLLLAVGRDPIDAYKDAEILKAVLERRMEMVLAKHCIY